MFRLTSLSVILLLSGLFICAAQLVTLHAGCGFDLLTSTTTDATMPCDFVLNHGIDELVTLTFTQATATVLQGNALTAGTVSDSTYPIGGLTPDLLIQPGMVLAIRGHDLRNYKLVFEEIRDSVVTFRYWAVSTPVTAGSIHISPPIAYLWPGASTTFRAITTGLPDQRLIWTVPRNDTGVVTALGVYMAPPELGPHAVMVKSAAEPCIMTIATIDVYRNPDWLLGVWTGTFPAASPFAGKEIMLVISQYCQPDITRPCIAFAGRLYLHGKTFLLRTPDIDDTNHISWTYHTPGESLPGVRYDGECLSVVMSIDERTKFTLCWEENMAQRNTHIPDSLTCQWTLLLDDQWARSGDGESDALILRKRKRFQSN